MEADPGDSEFALRALALLWRKGARRQSGKYSHFFPLLSTSPFPFDFISSLFHKSEMSQGDHEWVKKAAVVAGCTALAAGGTYLVYKKYYSTPTVVRPLDSYMKSILSLFRRQQILSKVKATSSSSRRTTRKPWKSSTKL